jgi:branched-chain amino acid transport system substrate-binding protein
MKKIRVLALVLAVVMCFGLAAGCSGSGSTATATPTAAPTAAPETIKVGILGCHTGEYAVYGLAVRNGAELYINQVNANGGINGKQIELIIYDNKADNTEAVTAFTRMVDEGITALIGDVLTGNTLAVVGEAYPINMPMITASATAASVTYDADSDTVYSNVFRTCFIDPFQGEKMAQYASEVLGAKTAAIIYETGNDYAIGLKDAFIAKAEALSMEVVAEEGYAKGDVDFKSQMTTIAGKSPDVVFCPNYYENDGLIVTQAREVGVTGTFLGGDGWSGVADYASAEDLEGSCYCSAYAPGSTDAVKQFEADYTAAYGEDTLNMFAANAYDAAMVLCNALSVAESKGLTPASDDYKQAVIDAIRDNSADLQGITSDGYSFDEYNNPIKSAVIMRLESGKEVFAQMF